MQGMIVRDTTGRTGRSSLPRRVPHNRPCSYAEGVRPTVAILAWGLGWKGLGMALFGRREGDAKPSTNPFVAPRRDDDEAVRNAEARAAEQAVNPYLSAGPPASNVAPEPFDAGLESPGASPRGRAGRPSRGDDKRTHRVGLSLSDREFEEWSVTAQLDGYSSIARWVRDRVQGTLNQRALHQLGAVKGMSDAARLRGDLAKVGSNLNQVARALNAAERGGPEGPSHSKVLEAVDATRRELAAVRAWTRGQE